MRRSRTSAVDDVIAKLRLRDTPAGGDYRQPGNVRFASGDASVRFSEPGPIHPSIRTAGYIERTGDLLAPVRARLLPPDDRTPFAATRRSGCWRTTGWRSTTWSRRCAGRGRTPTGGTSGTWDGMAPAGG